ncbi:sensor histidine kinase [Paenibacillus sp. GCM10028914]|uniref:sensor histidine kinase n=1 Tax=Paenibacillus sp. GCM10028914 TaxID=3273416 RepID=UPI003609811A
MVKYKLFRILLFSFIAILLAISLLFAITERVSENVLQQNLQNTSLNQLEHALQEMEQDLKQLEILTVLLSNDSSIKSYDTSKDFAPYLNSLLLRKTIEEKLLTQSYANIVHSSVYVYWPQLNQVLTSPDNRTIRTYNEEEWPELPKFKWFISDENVFELRYILVAPFLKTQNLSDVNFTVETSLGERFLQNVLTGVEAVGNGKAFFYNPNFDPVTSGELNEPLFQQIRDLYATNQFSAGKLNHQTVKINQEHYLIQSASSSVLDWELVHYIPLDDFLKPLNKTKTITRFSLVFLLLSGILMLLILYRNIMKPFSYLIRKIEALGKGAYESRVHLKLNNEYDYLFERFNEMAARIQTLIEDVYEEKLLSREAVYKQLQSQINPHFLYNCLFYIVSMAKKDPNAVTQMAQNLAEYYRFITKNNVQHEITLEEELKWINSYLSVQSLRNPKIIYSIDIEESMKQLLVPPLFLQPIVENSIVHGIDNKIGAGQIRISGQVVDSIYCFSVEDDGYGLNPEEMNQLISRIINKHNSDGSGFGLWNIHQRLQHRFGNSSGVRIEHSELGGLKVTVHWTSKEDERLL